MKIRRSFCLPPYNQLLFLSKCLSGAHGQSNLWIFCLCFWILHLFWVRHGTLAHLEIMPLMSHLMHLSTPKNCLLPEKLSIASFVAIAFCSNNSTHQEFNAHFKLNDCHILKKNNNHWNHHSSFFSLCLLNANWQLFKFKWSNFNNFFATHHKVTRKISPKRT